MGNNESLGITGIESVHYYVRDLERSRAFYTERMDFAEVGKSSTALEDETHQRSAVFRAGDVTVVCTQPVGEGSAAEHYLSRHPDGIGSVVFQVADVNKAFELVEKRGGTPMDSVQSIEDASGSYAYFELVTPFGDTTFRFAERKGYSAVHPGLETFATPQGGDNVYGVSHIDHITSNFNTMKPALLWMEHVLGFKQYWDVEFHTTDVDPKADHGSGLRSIVMYDPDSGVKFANNEPWRPYFKRSQIYLFNEDHRGDGIQHIALVVPDVIDTVRGLRERGVDFMPTPGAYYDMLPKRIEQLGIGSIDEDLNVLRELEILVDGEAPGKYMLQIFLKDSAATHEDKQAGPFFYEIIQRKGDDGFGAGNFRALFESIEREQSERL
ncbi:MAG: 4-hydroxyphenylpyruvate dioxygenase [Myxococcota bacterium]